MGTKDEAKDSASGKKHDQSLLRIELGGGNRPAGGYFNVDIEPGDNVDLVADFNKPLPFDDCSCREVYSSHCFEHVANVSALIREVARICVVGSPVTIKVPHFGQEMAMCPGHLHVLSEQNIEHFREFSDDWWTGPRKLSHISTEYTPTKWFEQASNLFPKLNRNQIFRYIQNTCHECVFMFVVQDTENYK